MPDSIPPDEAIDLTGKTVGDYQVLRKLGQGGMGDGLGVQANGLR